ncbi:CTD kinase subunit gamma CTK3-domain-containing protein [Boletus edulis]|nr:CTD kinase subunit gamma CTK3-domain-containing protein [Boletus edulis]
MDPFEVRMQFLGLLRKLNATQQSIQKVVGYALKYFSRCGEDLWEAPLIHRINILYFLDSLCESSLLAKAHQPIPAESSSCYPSSLLTPHARHAKQANTSFYVDYVSRDLRQIVECVVPVGRQGLPNLTSTKQILENWRTKRIIEPQRVDEVMQRPPLPHNPHPRAVLVPETMHISLAGEIFKRIEEDRERHKRLRERRWVQAQPQVLSHSYPSHHSQPHHPAAGSGPGSSSGTIGYTAYALASFLPLSESENATLALDIEFENEWDATSDWNEDDEEAVMEERELCEGGEEPMDLS